MTTTISDAAARFASDTANHEMTVLRDDGLYRHLRFKAPTTGFYWFDLVTWPGYLAFTGDMTGFVFARVPDMFEFFRTGRGINPGPWSEKVVTDQGGIRTYSEDRFRQLVAEHVDEHLADGDDHDYAANFRKAVQEDVLDDLDIYHEEGARQALNAFAFRPLVAGIDPGGVKVLVRGEVRFRFADTWEWDLTDWDWSFLWACHAIKWGIGQYDVARARVPLAEAGTR